MNNVMVRITEGGSGFSHISIHNIAITLVKGVVFSRSTLHILKKTW